MNCAASIANAFVIPKSIKVQSFVVYCKLVNKLYIKTQILSFLTTLLPYIQCLFGFSSCGVKKPILALFISQYFKNYSSDFKKFKLILAQNHKLYHNNCLLYTSPSPRDLSTSRMPSSA